eukprot:CAMPEP_0202688346 /NCGR_PEP_ID=MMETSP1385-20130828/3875_1 /ASSEMBLY_ACC=CAM_ASM_000861 /TAXON_ID=933848 /ORGANISM="Elphidium margaritaceum" /LENGTH=577 /DNA_ID=CAMNT_0049343297 /DNA_START=18 /DNA_END=1751 /DNA_ORIENTATION=+
MGSCFCVKVNDELDTQSAPLLPKVEAPHDVENDCKSEAVRAEVNEVKIETVATAVRTPPPSSATSAPRELSVMTWNIAGINNNPWEYYVMLDDPNYKSLMSNVEEFMTSDAQKLSVRDVLNEIDSKLLDKLLDLLREKQVVTNANEQRCKEVLESDIEKNYVTACVDAFLCNKHVGQHRLISWPDRLLNTIDDKHGGFVYRPTPINYYPTKFADKADWFAQWLAFMRDTGIDILVNQKNNKYADGYQKAGLGDADDFLFINVVLLCVFDAILVFMLFEIERQSNINWQDLKMQCHKILNKDKLMNTVGILNRVYGDCDVLFLQEVRNNFVDAIGADNELKAKYQIVFPQEKSKNNQTSIVCLKKTCFGAEAKIEEVSQEFYDCYKGSVKIGKGDLIALKVSKPNLMLVSFHGDTGGLATADVLSVIDEVVKEKEWRATHKLVIGLDANTYYDEFVGDKKDKFYSCGECNELLKRLSMAHCFDYDALPQHHTSNCPRTYLQPQLNKAVKRSDMHNKFVSFRSPKDYIMFYRDQFTLNADQTMLDNTGNKHYNGDVEYVLPAQRFPSDHAIVSTKLTMK